MTTFKLSILASDNKFYEGDCESLVVPTEEGERGILANHYNIIEAILPGKLRFRAPEEGERIAFVSQGLLKVEDNEVLVLVDSAQRPEDVDENRIKEEQARAKEELLQKRSRQEYLASKANLARAMNKLKGRHDYEVK